MIMFDNQAVYEYTDGLPLKGYIDNKYPDATDFDRTSWVTLVEYLLNGEYGGSSELASYAKERRAEAIIVAWGTAYLHCLSRGEESGAFSTGLALRLLEALYFDDEAKAIINLMDQLPADVAGRMVLFLLNYKGVVDELVETVGSFLGKKATTGDLRSAYRNLVPRSAPRYQN